jgi:hypothetical protein
MAGRAARAYHWLAAYETALLSTDDRSTPIWM